MRDAVISGRLDHVVHLLGSGGGHHGVGGSMDARQGPIPNSIVHLLMHEGPRLLRQSAGGAEDVEQRIIAGSAVDAKALAESGAAAGEKEHDADGEGQAHRGDRDHGRGEAWEALLDKVRGTAVAPAMVAMMVMLIVIVFIVVVIVLLVRAGLGMVPVAMGAVAGGIHTCDAALQQYISVRVTELESNRVRVTE